MSDILEKEWKQTLTFIVEELDNQQFEKLLELLSKIPKGQKTPNIRGNMAQIINEHYGLEDSVFAIVDAMETIPRRDDKIQEPLKAFVEKLKANTGKKRKRNPVQLTEKTTLDKKRKLDPNTTEQTEAGGSRPVMAKGILAGQPATETDTASWSKSICDLVAAHEVVATATIRGRIMDKSKLQTYKTQKKDFFFLLVTDETASIKMMVYGKPHYQKLQKGKHYLFRKLIRDKNLFKVTLQTIVAELGAFDIPKEVEEKAKRLSSHGPYVSIEEVKKWDSEILPVSVEGTITKVCPSELMVKGNNAKRRTKKQHFHIKDNTDSIEVVIWGRNVKKCENVAVGDVVKLTNMNIKNLESVTLQSTDITNIEQVRKFTIHNHQLKIVAVTKCQKMQTDLEVILDQRFYTMVVKNKLLAEAYSLSLGEKFRSQLMMALPLMGEAQIEGNEIKAIQNIEARI
ncbi:uncharacterized protein [Takifugu rubripes]|uniref:uncharacterized protein n=1 Tax=Takifugu rubripes TaxID=31033 RepID=UPI0011459166|nr:uncharacterized protein LOC105419338 [Takifugu rubripes]